MHQKDINDEWSDEKIWIYAKENNLTIISLDSDFSNKIIMSSPPPKVIHIRFGIWKEHYLDLVANTDKDMRIPYSNKKQILTTYENESILQCDF